MADNLQSNLIFGMKPKTFAMATTGVVIAASLVYVIYFDHKQRNDSELKKQLKRECKNVEKTAKPTEIRKLKLINQVLVAVEKEPLPVTPEAKEKYYIEQLAFGERLCAAGEVFYDDAVLPFYKAFKAYPDPLELMKIYQKTLPEPIVQTIFQLNTLEQNKRQARFYELFPPKETHVRLAEILAGESLEGKPLYRRGLVANEELKEGQVIYTESPLVSVLHPSLGSQYCNFCLKKIPEEGKIECSNCDNVAFCSAECDKVANENYHPYFCTNSKNYNEGKVNAEGEETTTPSDNDNAKEMAFLNYTKKKNAKYAYMVAKFLSTFMTEEIERICRGEPSETNYSSWDHIDHFRYIDTSADEETAHEMVMLKEMLGSKVQGISEFITNEIYPMLKGKMVFNAYAVNISEDVYVPESNEQIRKTSSDKKSVGAALYKISTYIGQSEAEPNVKLTFDDSHDISIVALKDISKDTELFASYPSLFLDYYFTRYIPWI
ncbi:hypothetical protein BDA99DRAFT_492839 [Phascolomyces articulosus]|uniref:MYND-type domain-containing protein n=1 Tax=Phascolomyces articulosus TaxID=60185 RepID=A0AAD5KCK2_9FUNG|nr:hypothetical protein BDA99DRAFT_492839 [Phascolomyces articulosus]